jgi:hypothetical protein
MARYWRKPSEGCGLPVRIGPKLGHFDLHGESSDLTDAGDAQSSGKSNMQLGIAMSPIEDLALQFGDLAFKPAQPLGNLAVCERFHGPFGTCHSVYQVLEQAPASDQYRRAMMKHLCLRHLRRQLERRCDVCKHHGKDAIGFAKVELSLRRRVRKDVE